MYFKVPFTQSQFDDVLLELILTEKLLFYRLGEKESEIGKLQAELKAKVQETSKLSDDLDAQRQKNNVSKR